MEERPLALDHRPCDRTEVVDHLLGSAGDEIGDHAIDRDPAPAKRIPVCPVAPNAASMPASAAARVISSAAVILPTLQSLPTVKTTNGRGWGAAARPPAGAESHPAGAGDRSRSTRCTSASGPSSGSSARKRWSPLTTSSPAVIASRMTARQGPGKPPPRGAIPIKSASGRARGLRRGSRRPARDARNRGPGRGCWPADFESITADDFRAAIAQQADRGLRAEDPERALGEDAEAAVGRSRDRQRSGFSPAPCVGSFSLQSDIRSRVLLSAPCYDAPPPGVGRLPPPGGRGPPDGRSQSR